jgi:TPR repeat protein
MRRGFVTLAVVTIVACADVGRAQDHQQVDPIAACDTAAAAAFSDDLPAGVVGVLPWKIDPKVAVPACEAAAKLAPDNARIAYQLGRAYIAEKSAAAAFAAFSRADERGYAIAAFNLAAMYRGVPGIPADPVKARGLLEKSARGGAVAAAVRGLEKASGEGDYSGDGSARPLSCRRAGPFQ